MRNQMRSVALFIVLLALLQSLASCGPYPPPGQDGNRANGQSEHSRPKLRALLVGVDHEIVDLPEGRNDSPFLRDAYQIAHWIHSLDSCAEIKILAGNSAKKDQILAELPWLSWQKDPPSAQPQGKENSLISVFFFSGHGRLSQSGNNDGYIIPYDGLHEGDQHGNPREELMISPRELFDGYGKWSSLSLFILDSCNSGVFASYLEQRPFSQNIRLITASQADQFSVNPLERHNSLFTQALYKTLFQLSPDATQDEIVFSTRARLHSDRIWESGKYKPEPAYFPIPNRETSTSRIPFYKTTARAECEFPVAAVRDVSLITGSDELGVVVDATNCADLVPGTEIERFMNREDKFRKTKEVVVFSVLLNRKESSTQCNLKVKPNRIVSQGQGLATGDLLLRRSVPRLESAIKVHISKECANFAKPIATQCPLCETVMLKEQAEYALEKIALNPTAPGDERREHSSPIPPRNRAQGCGWRRISTSNGLLRGQMLPESLEPQTMAEDLARDIEHIYNLKFWQSNYLDRTMPPWRSHRDVFPYGVQVLSANGAAHDILERNREDRSMPAITVKSSVSYRLAVRQTRCGSSDCAESSPRYVYLCSFDSHGRSELLFPNINTRPHMQALLPNSANNCKGEGCVLVKGIELTRKEKRLIVVQARTAPYSDAGNACTAFRQELSCKNSTNETSRDTSTFSARTASIAAALSSTTPPPDLLDAFIMTAE